MSITLVVIGLLVGGVLVGRDLIKAAETRAQMAQIEKYQAAVNTFQGKFSALPGDIPAASVAQFGFTATPTRAGTLGRGDGNGELDGQSNGTGYAWNQNGENLMFWEDLSANSGLIEGNFSSVVDGPNTACSSPSACAVYLPYAKIGNGNFVYVYSGYGAGCCAAYTGIGPNFFGIAVITGIASSNVAASNGAPVPGLTVSQAYAIDVKMDDGLPQSGNVMAQYLGWGGQPSLAPNAPAASAATCYDTTSKQYSITQNNGSYRNCVLSFQMK